MCISCVLTTFNKDDDGGDDDTSASLVALSAYSRPLLGGFGAYFPPNDVIYRCNSPKTTSLRGSTSFEPYCVKIGPTVRPGRRNEKKGKNRTVKSHKGVIFHLFEEKPPLNRFSQKFAQ